jgi:uncharacterized protein
VDFEWDEAKRQHVLRRRGIDLLYAARIFRGIVVTNIDDRHDYGERRFQSAGLVGDECFVVVYTERTGVIRLIPAWKGGRREQARYQASLVGRNRTDG